MSEIITKHQFLTSKPKILEWVRLNVRKFLNREVTLHEILNPNPEMRMHILNAAGFYPVGAVIDDSIVRLAREVIEKMFPDFEFLIMADDDPLASIPSLNPMVAQPQWRPPTVPYPEPQPTMPRRAYVEISGLYLNRTEQERRLRSVNSVSDNIQIDQERLDEIVRNIYDDGNSRDGDDFIDRIMEGLRQEVSDNLVDYESDASFEVQNEDIDDSETVDSDIDIRTDSSDLRRCIARLLENMDNPDYNRLLNPPEEEEEEEENNEEET